MFLILLCLSSGLVAISQADEKPYYDIEIIEELFEDFIKTYNRKYEDEVEKQMRLNIFRENLKFINHKNSVSDAVFAVNHFADRTEQERRRGIEPAYLRDDAESVCIQVTDKDITTKDAPDSLDWREREAVTPIRNQGDCGSCWAFATIGTVEAQLYIKHKKLKVLSVQELVDCSKSNGGCDGGIMTLALNDLIKIGGVQPESSYAYNEHKNTCNFNSSKVEVTLNGCTSYNLTDEVKLKEPLYTHGPIAVGVNGMGMSFYQKGIYKKEDCGDPNDLSHAVLLIGYGSENGTDYWLIKNSWGEKWGEKGYIRLNRGDNTCGLMNTYAASPIVD